MRAPRPKPGMVGSLFSGHHEPTGWIAPTSLPDLGVYPKDDYFGFDTEFRYFGNIFNSELAGLSLCTPDEKLFYLPVGHRGGGNLDENAVRRWAKNELAGRHLCILNAKDDVHVLHNWGLYLEEIGVNLHDPAFQTALLDENRYKFNLEILSQEVLGRGKKEIPTEKYNIFDCSASEIGPYAEEDAYLHYKLETTQRISIHEQGLHHALSLEDQLIYSTCAMERAGARLDRVKLERWIHEVELAHQEAILYIFRAVGFRINPNSTKDLRRLFDHLKLEYPRREEELGGDVTFEEGYISRVSHPVVRSVIAARKLDSLLSKYLRKYLKAIDQNNVLRYSLHQMRGDEYGTVTGRYASARVNIQQVFKAETQLEEEEINAWIIRELFIPDDGKFFVSADASQIEFRWFAHYSKSKRLIDAYNNDPTMDFHQLVANLLNQKRKDAKHNNFGKLYTMGIVKLARRLGFPCNCGCAVKIQWNRVEHTKECKMQKAFDISEEYDQKFPEANQLSQTAMRVAKDRGFVHTIMNRRRRYPTGERLNSALNAVIQGTAAETLKVKLLETYNCRKFLSLLLRFTVHDELDGDMEEKSKVKEWKDLLEAPDSRIPCRVPLLWDIEVGANWKECTL